MFDNTIKNPTNSWPFLFQSIKTQQDMDAARCVLDARISLILPRQRLYAASGKWFRVVLTDLYLQNNAATAVFSVQNSITHSNVQFRWHMGQFSAGSILDRQNSFFALGQYTQLQYHQLNLQLCAQCIMLTSQGATISIGCSPIHRYGVIQQSTKTALLNKLSFCDGHNTQLQYTDGKLSVFIAAGVGKQKPFTYHIWSQYSDSEQADSYIAAYRNGVKSINGITGDISIEHGKSISVVPQVSDSTLQLKLFSSNKQVQ